MWTLSNTSPIQKQSVEDYARYPSPFSFSLSLSFPLLFCDGLCFLCILKIHFFFSSLLKGVLPQYSRTNNLPTWKFYSNQSLLFFIIFYIIFLIYLSSFIIFFIIYFIYFLKWSRFGNLFSHKRTHSLHTQSNTNLIYIYFIGNSIPSPLPFFFLIF